MGRSAKKLIKTCNTYGNHELYWSKLFAPLSDILTSLNKPLALTAEDADETPKKCPK